MAIHSLGKQRESLTFSSELYKDAVRKYLDTMGYSEVTDSFTEGHLADMIFINPNIPTERKTHVEVKATEISVADKEFSKELLEYLVSWLNMPSNLRFKLFIFARKIRNKKIMEKTIGERYNLDMLKDWVSKNAQNLSTDLKDVVEKADLRDITAFVSYIDIYEADISQLTATTQQKNKYSNLSIQAYAQNLLQDVKRMGKPINKKSTLISNLVPLTIPSSFFTAKVRFKKKEELYSYYNKNDIEIPPINFFPEKHTISTFADLTKDNPLNEVIIDEPQQVNITSQITEQFIIGLINQHLRRIFWKKDLRRIPETSVYYFECPMTNSLYESKTYPNSSGKEKEVCKPYYKQIDGKDVLNFVYHHAVEMAAKKLWDEYYITIMPVKVYTSDGINPVDGDSAAAIDQTFRNQMFNRSSNRLSDIRFWHYHLFKSKFLNRPAEEWFKQFHYGELKSMPFDWIPQTVEKGQTLLEED